MNPFNLPHLSAETLPTDFSSQSMMIACPTHGVETPVQNLSESMSRHHAETKNKKYKRLFTSEDKKFFFPRVKKYLQSIPFQKDIPDQRVYNVINKIDRFILSLERLKIEAQWFQVELLPLIPVRNDSLALYWALRHFSFQQKGRLFPTALAAAGYVLQRYKLKTYKTFRKKLFELQSKHFISFINGKNPEGGIAVHSFFTIAARHQFQAKFYVNTSRSDWTTILKVYSVFNAREIFSNPNISLSDIYHCFVLLNEIAMRKSMSVKLVRHTFRSNRHKSCRERMVSLIKTSSYNHPTKFDLTRGDEIEFLPNHLSLSYLVPRFRVSDKSNARKILLRLQDLHLISVYIYRERLNITDFDYFHNPFLDNHRHKIHKHSDGHYYITLTSLIQPRCEEPVFQYKKVRLPSDTHTHAQWRHVITPILKPYTVKEKWKRDTRYLSYCKRLYLPNLHALSSVQSVSSIHSTPSKTLKKLKQLKTSTTPLHHLQHVSSSTFTSSSVCTPPCPSESIHHHADTNSCAPLPSLTTSSSHVHPPSPHQSPPLDWSTLTYETIRKDPQLLRAVKNALGIVDIDPYSQDYRDRPENNHVLSHIDPSHPIYKLNMDIKRRIEEMIQKMSDPDYWQTKKS